jgi:hypothetical protein
MGVNEGDLGCVKTPLSRERVPRMRRCLDGPGRAQDHSRSQSKMNAALPQALALVLALVSAGCGRAPLIDQADASADGGTDAASPADLGSGCDAFASLQSAADLPVGVCTGQARCTIQTHDSCPGASSPGPTQTWQCDCRTSSWFCALASTSKLDCGAPACPAAQPTNDASCAQPGVWCTWGSDTCPSHGVCKSQRWAVTTPSCIPP